MAWDGTAVIICMLELALTAFLISKINYDKAKWCAVIIAVGLALCVFNIALVLFTRGYAAPTWRVLIFAPIVAMSIGGVEYVANRPRLSGAAQEAIGTIWCLLVIAVATAVVTYIGVMPF